MAQTYQMKHNPQGTIYSLLTVENDGRMTMTFHGTDREISHEVTENADGWLCYPGAMFPGLASGKWNKMEDVVETADCADSTDNEPLSNNRETITNNRARRQRRQRKPRVERQPSDISHQTSDIDHQTSDIDHQTSSTLKAIGMVAAASVALFVIYETGLLIPLGLIGLATGGILR